MLKNYVPLTYFNMKEVDTRVVYYMFSTSSEAGYAGYGYAYFAPYISENGNFCRYLNDEIVEITVEDTNN